MSRSCHPPLPLGNTKAQRRKAGLYGNRTHFYHHKRSSCQDLLVAVSNGEHVVCPSDNRYHPDPLSFHSISPFHFSFSLARPHGSGGAPQMRTRHSEVEPQHAKWTQGCPQASPPASPDPPPLHSPPITSFDTPKGRWGCPWAHGVCSLYTVRGCKLPGDVSAKTRTGFGPLSLSFPALSGCGAIKYSCEHKTTPPQQTANWLRVKKKKTTQTLTHRQCTTTEY